MAAAPEVISQAGITAGQDYGEGVNLVGFDPDTGTHSVTSLPAVDHDRATSRSAPPSRTSTAAILLGARLANRLSVYPGDVVTLVPVTQAKVNPALGVAVPRFWRFEVTGLFDTGMFQYDNQFVVVSLEVAQKFTGLGEAVSGIAVRVDDPDRAPEIGDAARETARLPLSLPRLADPEREPVQRAPAREAGDGTDYLLHHGGGRVQHRGHPHDGRGRQDPGDRHSARHGPDLARGRPASSCCRGRSSAEWARRIGLATGLTVAYVVDKSGWVRINPAVYFIDHLPVHVEASDVAVVVLASLAIAVLATLYPSRAAAGLTPVDAIRHE